MPDLLPIMMIKVCVKFCVNLRLLSTKLQFLISLLVPFRYGVVLPLYITWETCNRFQRSQTELRAKDAIDDCTGA